MWLCCSVKLAWVAAYFDRGAFVFFFKAAAVIIFCFETCKTPRGIKVESSNNKTIPLQLVGGLEYMGQFARAGWRSDPFILTSTNYPDAQKVCRQCSSSPTCKHAHTHTPFWTVKLVRRAEALKRNRHRRSTLGKGEECRRGQVWQCGSQQLPAMETDDCLINTLIRSTREWISRCRRTHNCSTSFCRKVNNGVIALHANVVAVFLLPVEQK